MKQLKILLENPGVYFFAKNMALAQINRNLLLAFYVPQIKATGIVLFDTNDELKHLLSMLDNLHAEICEQAGKELKEIEVKAFGLSTYHPKVLDTVNGWLKKKKLNISTQDLGKNVTRNITVECDTGVVGVSYAEKYESHPGVIKTFGNRAS